jgi:hypothetical protein
MATLPENLNLGAHPKTKVSSAIITCTGVDRQFSMVVDPLEGMLKGKESAIIVGIEVSSMLCLQKHR